LPKITTCGAIHDSGHQFLEFHRYPALAVFTSHRDRGPDCDLAHRQAGPGAGTTSSGCCAVAWALPHGHTARAYAMAAAKLIPPALLGSARRIRDFAQSWGISRVVHPGSKLSTLARWHDMTFAADPGIEHTAPRRACAAMDWMEQEGRRTNTGGSPIRRVSRSPSGCSGENHRLRSLPRSLQQMSGTLPLISAQCGRSRQGRMT